MYEILEGISNGRRPPFIPFMDPNKMVRPLEVDFGKDGRLLELVTLGVEDIDYHNLIQTPVVNTGAEITPLRHRRDPPGMWREE